MDKHNQRLCANTSWFSRVCVQTWVWLRPRRSKAAMCRGFHACTGPIGGWQEISCPGSIQCASSLILYPDTLVTGFPTTSLESKESGVDPSLVNRRRDQYPCDVTCASHSSVHCCKSSYGSEQSESFIRTCRACNSGGSAFSFALGEAGSHTGVPSQLFSAPTYTAPKHTALILHTGSRLEN